MSHLLLSVQDTPSCLRGLEQTPDTGSHTPAVWQVSDAVQTNGFEPTHVPAWQVSVCVHALESLQGVASGWGGLEHIPVPKSHVPAA